MGRAFTSIVLIFGQLALVCAMPLTVCTSADGTQRVEWGECECAGEAHSHDSAVVDPCDHEQQLADHPCRCQHRPLSEGMQFVTRDTSDPRDILPSVFDAGEFARQQPTPLAVHLLAASSACGHTALSDRLSIRLRC